MIEFRVLGPVELHVNGRTVDLGPPKQRVVLAALLVDAGRPVSIETLINRVWDERPPQKARTVLYAHITRIRRALKSTGTPHPRVERRSDGYVLDIHPDLVDLHRFRRLVDQARDTNATDVERVTVLHDAQRLWRGTPLAGLPGEWPSRIRESAEQQRLGAALAWAEAERHLGHHQPVVDQLGELLADHPLAEPLVAELMRALYGAGRSAEALALYAAARERLADELGADPGPDLRRLHEQILRHDESLSSPQPAVPTAGPPAAPAPRQLPADAANFTGRSAEVDRLLTADDGRAASEAGSDPAVAVYAIDGMPGVGKTALAVHAAHRLAPRYPDGQLFVDLHGYTPDLPPTDPAAALDHMLRSLGVPGERIPEAVEERAALFRSRLAGRQVLLVLDNAVTDAQVHPLLPGTPGCLVLVTSRVRLTGLDAAVLSLEALPLADAAALLTRSVGANRLSGTGPGASVTETIVELCGRLPLAIRIAAARLRHRPHWSADHLAELLRDERGRLDELEAGQHSVATAVHLSYQQLSGEQQRMFRYLSLHPGLDIEPYAAAALAGTTIRRARRLLEELLDAHLLSQQIPGRYTFHDLVRAHATEQAHSDCPEADRCAALTRLIDHYAHTAATAMDVVYPADVDQRPRAVRPDTPRPDVNRPETAEDWLEAELGNLLASAAHATHDRPDHTVFLSATLGRHLYTRARCRDAEALHDRASAAAHATGDQAGEQDALRGLGTVYYIQGRFEQAADCFSRALKIARDLRNRTGEQEALRGLGNVDYAQGRFEQAADHFGQALTIARDTGNRAGELNTLGGLGYVHRAWGRFERAADLFEQALRIARDTGDRAGEQNALRGLSDVHRVLGRLDLAADHIERALEIARDTGNRAGELYALCGLGGVRRLQGKLDLAADHIGRALEIARDIGYRAGEQYALYGLGHVHLARGGHGKAVECFGRVLEIARATHDRDGQFEAHHGLGRARHATGCHEQALADHHSALDLATALGQPADMARAHDGLAHVHRALGHHARARHHWRTAMDVLVSHGVTHTDDPQVTTAALREHLAELDSGRAPAP